MSTIGASPGLSLDTGGVWHQRAMQRSRALARTYLLSSSVPPMPPSSGGRLRDPLCLPSLAAAKAPHRQTTVAPLSISEPFLFTPGERAVVEGFSRNRRPPLRKRPPPLPLCKSCDTGERNQNQNQNQSQSQSQSCRPVYTHFSHPIRPNFKVVRPCSQSFIPAKEQKELRPLVVQYRQSSQGGALTVRGKPCLPKQPSPPVSPVPTRTQLHIFLPTEGAGEGQEGDSESVDEGFMDELDSKITSLKLQLGVPKTHSHPD